MNNAIVLLSGGLDSVVSLACLKDKYNEILALTFDYSQNAVQNEIKSAKAVSNYYGIENRVIKLNWLGEISNSLLNNNSITTQITEDDLDNKEASQNSAKAVWVPNRNALFINIAASFAEALNYTDIIIGANKEEGETFIDNSLQFINSINKTLEFSVNKKITVKAPLIGMTKQEIVKNGIELNIPFNLIYSCYNSKDKHCGKCESCIRLKRALKKCLRDDIIQSIFS